MLTVLAYLDSSLLAFYACASEIRDFPLRILGFIHFGSGLPPPQLSWGAQLSRYRQSVGGAHLPTDFTYSLGTSTDVLFILLMSFSGQRAKVLVIGHSIVFWAGRYTARSGWGANLGLGPYLDLDWHGH